jgi:hypothetical protein
MPEGGRGGVGLCIAIETLLGRGGDGVRGGLGGRGCVWRIACDALLGNGGGVTVKIVVAITKLRRVGRGVDGGGSGGIDGTDDQIKFHRVLFIGTVVFVTVIYIMESVFF